MNWDRFIALVTLTVDIGILWILIAEYNYDRIVYEKQAYKKKPIKPKVSYEKDMD